MGFGVLKFCLECVNFIGLIIISKMNLDQEILKLESLSDILDFPAFWGHVKLFSQIAVGWYTGYVGLELVTVMVGLTGDINLIGAWVAVSG